MLVFRKLEEWVRSVITFVPSLDSALVQHQSPFRVNQSPLVC